MPRKKVKSNLSVGRTKWRCNVYFWYSESTERRVGFFFPSRKEANTWRNQAYWRYAEYPVLEHFLATRPKTMWEREKKWWMRHKSYYLDLTLEVGAVTYVGAKFKKRKTQDDAR